MPRGYPDYNVLSTAIGAVSFDTAELAARLGGLSRVNRLGQVIYQDDFMAYLSRWKLTTTGLGNGYNVVTPVFDGEAAVALGAADTVASSSRIEKPIPLHDLARFGLEVVFGFQPDGAGTNVGTYTMYVYHPTVSYMASVKIDMSTDYVSIYGYTLGDGVNWVTIISDMGVMNPNYSYVTYHNLKLIIDATTGRYVRLFVDDRSVDLSSYYMTPLGAGTYESLLVQIYHSCNRVVDKFYNDSLIVTMNEP
jgi:hypothetical protein